MPPKTQANLLVLMSFLRTVGIGVCTAAILGMYNYITNMSENISNTKHQLDISNQVFTEFRGHDEMEIHDHEIRIRTLEQIYRDPPNINK